MLVSQFSGSEECRRVPGSEKDSRLPALKREKLRRSDGFLKQQKSEEDSRLAALKREEL